MNPFLLLAILLVAFFSFLTVAVWSDNRRKEREAFYRSEVLRKIAEGAGGVSVAEVLREQERLARRRRIEGMRVGGLVTTAVSAAFSYFLNVVTTPNRPGAWTLGLVPLSLGLALLAYGYLLAPKEPPDGPPVGK